MTPVSDILQKFQSLKHQKVVNSSTINYIVVALLCHAIFNIPSYELNSRQ